MTTQRKIKFGILCLVLLVCSVFLFTACKSKVDNFKLSFKVDGETYQTITTSGNEAISIPENPTKEGYTFDGWYWDNGTWQEPFTANFLLDAPISSDMSVYAKWTKNTTACQHRDADENSLCDNCGESYTDGNANPEHTHEYNQQSTDSKYLATSADCENAATYYYSCSCGAKDTATFISGNSLGHNYVNYICSRCNDTITTSKGLNFTLNSDGEGYTVSGIGTCKDTNLVIPSTYENKPVTSIGSNAFYCDTFTSVTIPNSVTSIGSFAFWSCESLTSITIPNSVTSIDNGVFWDCKSLTSVTIPNSVISIGEYAFSNCESLTSITIPNSVTSIDRYAFEYCDSLTSVHITDMAKWCAISFGIYANPLRYANNLYLNGELVTNLLIPDSVTSIGFDAFNGCTSLTSVTIPNSVTNIGSGAFKGCTSLTYNEYDNAYYLGNSTNPYLLLVKAKNTSIKSCKIHEDVKFIYDQAFEDCRSFTSVTIPDSVTSIGDFAFHGCDGLTSVTIPNSITSIGIYAFCGCKSLTSVTIPDSVTSIGYDAFRDCTSLTSATIGDGVTSIENEMFCGCKSLTSVTIGDSVTSIGRYVFRYCNNLTSITFKDALNWYRVWSADNWNYKTGGTSTSVTNSSTNATYFKSTYYDYFWYKL